MASTACKCRRTAWNCSRSKKPCRGAASLSFRSPRKSADVTVAAALWSRVTDFGLTLFDEQGHPIADGPLNHAFGRLTLPLDSTDAGRRVAIELLPAFALARAPPEWEAHVTLTFQAREPLPLSFLNGADPVVSLAAGESMGLQFAPVPANAVHVQGFDPLLRVTADPGDGPVSVRVGSWVR